MKTLSSFIFVQFLVSMTAWQKDKDSGNLGEDINSEEYPENYIITIANKLGTPNLIFNNLLNTNNN
ncbi:MAG: hypothetical protein HN336_09330 [Lentimicrobiaceae bacterium]|jgi:hypothetical protein|nr:hypothetical protein [Lentimicrobiaceae bacterium]MCP4911062.1 hypothetical protein [Bacteroidota bacterium]MBT3453873.1 hypothetical protein [Lentimicrobiaceae bacterium]MBT3818035.1 hypothetical protein [Lentimicrobiaceae bacterium]MBT4060958.1 hypothetical protein [Lentimicrobiaceae bacterium]|tara:strand:- start:844 stop:1041 length:198 start_codon:yes stop_codon:yes gene_type:complete